MAMVQGAVFDAINSIDHEAAGYLVKQRFARFGSLEAAGAQAAHDVLVALYPAQQAFLDGALAQTLAEVPNGPGEMIGMAAGRFAAKQMLQARKHDGATIDGSYTARTDPGHWQPDPMNPSQAALGVNWGSVQPFAISGVGAIDVPSLPPMDSAAYTAAFNEVKTLGGNGTTTPTSRTAEQTEIGLFWAYDIAQLGTPVALYNQVLQTVSTQEGSTTAEKARLFALANFAMADAGIVTWSVKWSDDFWRPVMAIRNAAADGNPSTVQDATWTPLGAPGDGYAADFTPPFPAYPSGHAAFGGATFATLQDFYGTDALTFTLHSDEFDPALGGRPSLTRTYNSFSAAMQENAQSRIYLGIHWQFDATCGIDLGEQVAAKVAGAVLREL